MDLMTLIQRLFILLGVVLFMSGVLFINIVRLSDNPVLPPIAPGALAILAGSACFFLARFVIPRQNGKAEQT